MTCYTSAQKFSNSGFSDPAASEFLTRAALKECSITSAKTRTLLLSVREGRTREFSNKRNISHDLTRVARALGLTYKEVNFVKGSFCNQVRLAFEASILVGLHGAGLINCLWLRAGAVLVEIYPFSQIVKKQGAI